MFFKDIVFGSQSRFFYILSFVRRKVFMKNILKCSFPNGFILSALIFEIFYEPLLIGLGIPFAFEASFVFRLSSS